jgi:hypothetical protein
VLRYLAQPRWIPWHLFCAAALAGCVYMAWWQWDVATAPTAPGVEVSVWRNYAYAVNWWIFAGVGVWFWWRLPRDQMRADQASEVAEAEGGVDVAAGASAHGVGAGQAVGGDRATREQHGVSASGGVHVSAPMATGGGTDAGVGKDGRRVEVAGQERRVEVAGQEVTGATTPAPVVAGDSAPAVSRQERFDPFAE